MAVLNKRCRNGHPLTIDNIYWQRRGDRKYRQCKECKREAVRQWRRRHGAGLGRVYVRNTVCKRGHAIEDRNGVRKCYTCQHFRWLLSRYGVSFGWYDKTLKRQGGKCAICLIADPYPKNFFCLDHCHKTGRPRGLLCDRCNRGVECFRDDPEVMRAAARYMERPKLLRKKSATITVTKGRP